MISRDRHGRRVKKKKTKKLFKKNKNFLSLVCLSFSTISSLSSALLLFREEEEEEVKEEEDKGEDEEEHRRTTKPQISSSRTTLN